MRGRHNRHGFQNYGGKSTGMPYPLDEGDIANLRQIDHLIEKYGSLTTETYDCINRLGEVIRYSLRKAKMIVQHQRPPSTSTYISLTPEAARLLNALEKRPSKDSNLP